MCGMLAHARSQKHWILGFGAEIFLILNFEAGGEAQQDLPSAFWIKIKRISQLAPHVGSTRTMLNQRAPMQAKPMGASGFRAACIDFSYPSSQLSLSELVG